jgi:pyruvate/2-oxoglutarate/acetoin dehydrogenase E1 component
LYKEDLIDIEKVYANKESSVFQYTEGKSATIVCFNFSFPYGWELFKRAKEKGMGTSLFSVNTYTPTNWERIVENAGETHNLVIFDDSKSENLSCYSLINDILNKTSLENKIIVKRDMSGDWLSPSLELLDVDYQGILERISR